MPMEMRRRRRSSPSSCPSSRRRRSSAAVAVGRKVRELRRLVPGAAAMPADRLLLRTADYIAQLRARVELLRALSELCVPGEGHDHGDGGVVEYSSAS